VPLDLTNNIDDNLFLFPRYGSALLHPKMPFKVTRTDIYLFDAERNMAEFEASFKISEDIDPAIKAKVRDIIQSRWDCFYEARA